jgi:hypothetical protein
MAPRHTRGMRWKRETEDSFEGKLQVQPLAKLSPTMTTQTHTILPSDLHTTLVRHSSPLYLVHASTSVLTAHEATPVPFACQGSVRCVVGGPVLGLAPGGG